MNKSILNAVAIATLAASFAAGQPTVANRVARLTTLLTLTTAQQTQATTIFTTEETALTPIRTSLDTARTALNAAILKNDSAAIVTEATQIGTLTTQQVEAQAKADASFYALLTTDQQTKYTELKSAGFGGPGGPGGPGHGGPH
jgi:Spy/CpxP family protein refolding chaperone